jgi:hypothetical protein
MSTSVIRRTLITFLAVILSPAAKAADNTPAKEIAREMKQLYDELMIFKGKPKFHQMGFAAASPFKPWHDRVQSLGAKMQASGLQGRAYFQAGFTVAPSSLYVMALDYMKSSGSETSSTKTLQKDLLDTFAAVLGE